MNQSEQLEQPEETVRRVFVIRLWRDAANKLDVRGEVQWVGHERTVYIRSVGELLDHIQAEMSAPDGEATAVKRPSGLGIFAYPPKWYISKRFGLLGRS
jgi:hypothetical protein